MPEPQLDPAASAERVEEFVRLLGQNQRRVFLYVLGLVPRWADAEEIVQQTNLLLWREFTQFQSGTNFAAWACKVAFHQVLAWRKRQQRDRLQFSDEVFELLAADAREMSEELEERTHALAGCLERLPPPQRELIRLRYDEGQTVEAIAARQDRTVEAVYRALSRVRQALHDCISRRLRQGEVA